MNKICPASSCTGCMACYNVCPFDAIEMKIDQEGFFHPIIKSQVCKDCHLCQKVCPSNNTPLKRSSIKVFSAWNKDDKIRINSSSGGIFSEIAKYIIAHEGVVFGCKLDESQKAVHCYIDKIEDLHLLRGSKYLQSNVKDTYRQVKRLLQEKRMVLFSGTPCQISGLINYIGKESANLLTIDFVCHGVPSGMVFTDYLNMIKKKYSLNTIKKVNFRDKSISWRYYGIKTSDGTKTHRGSYLTDPFLRAFNGDFILRPSCHFCKYATPQRVSDITLADWWGYKRERPEDCGFMTKGVSLIMLNTEKAISLFPQLNIHYRERTIEEALKTNPSLSHSFPPSPVREEFWTYYHSHSFEEVIEKYLQPLPMSIRMKILDNYKNTDILLSIVNFCISINKLFKH